MVMDKNESIAYLQDRKILTARVATAENRLSQAQANLEYAKRKWRKTIIGFIAFLALALFNGGVQGDDIIGFFLFAAVPAFLIYRKITHWIQPAQHELDEATASLTQERNDPNYLKGMQGFPEKFYNYADVYRLHKLMTENRADTLKEAYTLLESQHFYEDQLSVQEEIRSLQADTAASAKTAAVASSIAAASSLFDRR